MFRRIINLIMLLSMTGFLWTSCSDDGLIKPREKRTAKDVSAGEVHNEFVRAYLERCPERWLLTRGMRVQMYVETAITVCKERNYDYEPVQEQMDEFLATCEEWRRKGIWDICNPSTICPTDALDKFIAAGVIPKENTDYLHGMLEGLQRKCIDPRHSLTFAIPPSKEMEVARDLLQSSCRFWYSQPNGALPIEFSVDTKLYADWWKTALKYLGVGACDGLAGWAAFYAFGGNPFAVGFFGGIASVAAYDAFEERGW
jgi:hypothetical protein